MGVGGIIGTFVEIRPPYGSGLRNFQIMVLFEDRKGYPIFNGPGRRLGNFLFDPVRQTMSNHDLVYVFRADMLTILTGFKLMVK